MKTSAVALGADMQRHSRSWALCTVLCACVVLSATLLLSQDLQLPADYGIDLQLAEAGRSHIMAGSLEITGTAANEIGDEVFHRLISAGFDQPFPWKLTLVNNGVVNASSTAGGKVYVHGGMVSLLGQNEGLWAAVLSHEAAHTARRHQVRVYLQEVFNQRMIAYYRARAAAGDKNANWSLIGFAAASKIALKKLERDQEHDADQQGMLLMARAGYHPDYVFALHHLLLMKTGEQSKFAAFFSDHPRWETRDQRSDRVYGDALNEFNHLWSDPAASPGGSPPIVAFVGQPEVKENKATETADVSVPLYCRNSDRPVDFTLVFEKDNHPVKAADAEFSDKDGNLVFHERADCLEKNETIPVLVHIPARAVSAHDRSVKATAYVWSQGNLVGNSKLFDVHFPVARRTARTSEGRVHTEPIDQSGRTEIAQATPPALKGESNAPARTTESGIAPAQSELSKAKDTPTISQDEGTLSITSSNVGADIFVDSTGRGKAPTIFKVKAGKHSVQVALRGYQDWVQEVFVEVGGLANVTANLRPVATVTAEARPPNTPSTSASVSVTDTGNSKTESNTVVETSDKGREASQSRLTPVQIKERTAESSICVRLGIRTENADIAGARISEIAGGSAADHLGLRVGYVITFIDGRAVAGPAELETQLQNRPPGTTVRVGYMFRSSALSSRMYYSNEVLLQLPLR
jgi:Zn-dependent protease with chaperone function